MIDPKIMFRTVLCASSHESAMYKIKLFCRGWWYAVIYLPWLLWKAYSLHKKGMFIKLGISRHGIWLKACEDKDFKYKGSKLNDRRTN